MFGCEAKKLKPELQLLCNNPKIIAGTNYPPFVYVFRDGKYWIFDNIPKKDKPIGEVVEGGKEAKIKWPGIHFPGGVIYNKFKFIVIYETKWSRWRTQTIEESGQQINVEKDKIESIHENKDINSDFNEVKDELIIEVESDETEGDNSESGALINIDQQKGKYAKVNGSTVCYVIIKNNKCNWSGNCLNVNEDQNNFPPNIIAAIETSDNYWYYLNENGKYCKRKDQTYVEVNHYYS